MKPETEKIFTIIVDYKSGNDNLQRINESLKEVNSSSRALQIEQNRLAAELKKGAISEAEFKTQSMKNGQQMGKNRQTLIALNDEKKKATLVTNKMAIAENAQKGSILEVQNRLIALRSTYRQLSDEQRNSMSVGKSMHKEISKLDSEYRKLEKSIGNTAMNVGNYSGKFKQLLGWIGFNVLSITGVASAVTSGFKNAAKIIIDFEQANANLATILGTNVGEISDLTEGAKQLGETTEWSASQVTQLQTELAKLGFTKQEIVNMQEPILQFATAIGADLPGATALAGAALRAFNLDSTETDRVVSVMAVGANKSALSFDYLNTAMATIAPVANAFGFSIEDTTALLGTLSDAGFDASMAATATRNILLNLADSGGKLARELGQPVKTLPDLVNGLQLLKDRGVDLNTTLELTDKRSVAAFNTFLQGADKLLTLQGALSDVEGELKRIQEGRLDTVEGSVKLLNSAWEGLILSFSGATGPMKDVVDHLSLIIAKIGEILDPDGADKTKKANMVKEIADQASIDLKNIAETYKSLGFIQEEANAMAVHDYEVSLNKRIRTTEDQLNDLNGLLTKDNGFGRKLTNFFMGGIGKVGETWYVKSNQIIHDIGVLETRLINFKNIPISDIIKPYSAATENNVSPITTTATLTNEQKRAAKQAAQERDRAAKVQSDLVDANSAKILAQENALIDTEIALMQEGYDKKLATSEQAFKKQSQARDKEHQAQIDKIDAQQAKLNADSPQYKILQDQTGCLTINYEAIKRQDTELEAKKRIDILMAASDEELKIYAQSLSGNKLKLEVQGVLFEKRAKKDLDTEIDKQLKIISIDEKSRRTIAEAEDRYATQKRIIEATSDTSTKSGKQRLKEDIIQNEIEIRKAKVDTYIAELNTMQSLGLVDTERYNEILRKLKEIKTEAENIGKTGNGIPNFTRTVGWDIKNLNFNHYGSKTLRQIVQGTCSQIKHC